MRSQLINRSVTCAVAALLLVACGGNPAPRPPATEPEPSVASLVVLCHVTEEDTSWLSQRLEFSGAQIAEIAEHIPGHTRDYLGECSPTWRPPRPRPSPDPKDPSPAPSPPPKPDRLTICHVFDREPGKDRSPETLMLPRERAEWHLGGHKLNGDRQGPDYAGPCKVREKP